MNQDGTIELFRYWNTLRGSRPAPRRAEVEPADIRRLLADTFILDAGTGLFRLAGTRLCAAYGRELKGTPLASLFRADDRPIVSRLVETSAQAASVVTLTVTATSARGRLLDCEMLFLPLACEPDELRLLGSVLPVRRPYWLGADPLIENRLASLRVVEADAQAPIDVERTEMQSPSLMPDGSSMMLEVQGGRRIRHLLVLDGGRDES